MESPGIKEVVLAATELIPVSLNPKRQKTDGNQPLIYHQGPHTGSQYTARVRDAWKASLVLLSLQLALDRVEPFHLGMFLRRHLGGVATQRQHLSAIRLLFDELLEQGVAELDRAARLSRHAWKEKARTRQSLKRLKSRLSWTR